MVQAVTSVLNKSHFSLQMGNCPISVAEHSGHSPILQDPVMLLGDVSVRNFAALSTVSSLCLGAIIGLSTLLGRQACFVHGVTIDDE